MSLRDFVAGGGCDASQSSNPLAQFANGVVDAAKASEGARFGDTEHQPPAAFHQLPPGSHMGPAELAGVDDMDRLLSALHLDPGTVLEDEDLLPEGGGFPALDWAANFMPGSAFSPVPSQYNFADNNIFLQDPQAFEHGMKLFHEGRLGEAIFALEAEVQRNPNNSDAWRWLGTAHAENDEDKVAVIALQRSLTADPENIEALFDGGVSHTNELTTQTALSYLRDWLLRHPEYAEIVASSPDSVQEPVVIDMFTRASQLDPSDPDVWAALGVLYNITANFDLAEQAFQRALEIDPANYSYWNKLGATQANSHRKDGSKIAVKAYRKALELKPNYVRAWVNMGVSYANQHHGDLAAKYYLKALSLNPRAEHVWRYLYQALQSIQRPDLAELVGSKNIEPFRAHFQF